MAFTLVFSQKVNNANEQMQTNAIDKMNGLGKQNENTSDASFSNCILDKFQFCT